MNADFIFTAESTRHDYRGWAALHRGRRSQNSILTVSPLKVISGAPFDLTISVASTDGTSLMGAALVICVPFEIANAPVSAKPAGSPFDGVNTLFAPPILELKLPERYSSPKFEFIIPSVIAQIRPGGHQMEAFVKRKGENGYSLVPSGWRLQIEEEKTVEPRVYVSNNFSGALLRCSVAAEQSESASRLPKSSFTGTLNLATPTETLEFAFEKKDAGVKKLRLQLPDRNKPFTVKTFFAGSANFAESELSYPGFMEDEGMNVYFGDLHVHSRESDGLGAPEEVLRNARDWKRLDFCALNDHIEQRLSWTTWNKEKWKRIKRINDEFTENGEFVAIPGFEYRSYCNLWCFDDEYVEYIAPEYQGDDEHPVALPKDAPEHAKLAAEIQREIERFTKKPNWLVGYHRMETFAATFDKTPVPVHLLQMAHGKRPPEIGSELFLERGDKVAFFGGTDTHLGVPGQVFSGPRNGRSGLTAVIAEELTRDAIHDALRSGRCYATMGSRTLMSFKVNGRIMGDVVELSEETPIETVLRVAGIDIIDRVELVLNGKIVFSKKIGAPESLIEWSANHTRENSGHIFAKAHLRDKRTIWSSPIYFTIKTSPAQL